MPTIKEKILILQPEILAFLRTVPTPVIALIGIPLSLGLFYFSIRSICKIIDFIEVQFLILKRKMVR